MILFPHLDTKGLRASRGPASGGKQRGATLVLPDPEAATVIPEGLWQEAESSRMASLGTQACELQSSGAQFNKRVGVRLH